jgi:hypothetical protein
MEKQYRSHSWIDRTGKKYGRLTAIEYKGDQKWLCRCDCGKECITSTAKLNSKNRSCGCRIGKSGYKNYMGYTYGKLTATREISEGLWEMTCECGNKIQTLGYKIKNNKSCGCLVAETKKKNGLAHRRPERVTETEMYHSHKSNAKSRGCLPLTKEDWLNIVYKPCHYCGGIDTKNYAKYPAYQKKKNLTLTEEMLKLYEKKINGIDRVDSRKDYIVENCVPCCSHCNVIKMDYSQEKFLEKIKQIYNHYIKQK